MKAMECSKPALMDTGTMFTWSASGAIITEAFATSAPTMVAYILDTPRCQQPQTFMSNMLQVGCCT